MFQINDKVVCVDDSPGKICREKHLARGKVYVVSGINDNGGGDVGFWLTGQNLAWSSYRFRKLSDIKAENAAKRAEFHFA